MRESKKILGLMLYESPWQYYFKYKRFLHELKSPFLNSIEFFTDTNDNLASTFEKIDKYKVIIFFYHDPLKQLYPEVYNYAKKIKSYCIKKGIIFVNDPDALSLSQKSIQLNLLRNKKINVAKTYSFNNWNDFLSNKRTRYPIFFRYDIGHDSLGEGCSEPFESKKEFTESKIWKNKKWDKMNHLEGIVAVEWIDTKSKDGFYRKYRVFVFGNSVIKGPLQISSNWFVHGNNAIKNKVHALENGIFMKKNCNSKERKLFLKINKILGLDFSAIDYSYDKNGKVVIWEANPHPSLGEWAEKDPFRTNFTNELSKFYQSKLM